MGFSKQEYWSRLSFPPPMDLPHISSSNGSSPLRDRTRVSCVSCIAGGSLPAEPLGKPQQVRLVTRASSAGEFSESKTRGREIPSFSQLYAILSYLTGEKKNKHTKETLVNSIAERRRLAERLKPNHRTRVLPLPQYLTTTLLTPVGI